MDKPQSYCLVSKHTSTQDTLHRVTLLTYVSRKGKTKETESRSESAWATGGSREWLQEARSRAVC